MAYVIIVLGLLSAARYGNAWRLAQFLPDLVELDVGEGLRTLNENVRDENSGVWTQHAHGGQRPKKVRAGEADERGSSSTTPGVEDTCEVPGM